MICLVSLVLCIQLLGLPTLFTHLSLPSRWTLTGESSRCVDTGSTILTDLHLTLVHINGTVGPLPLLRTSAGVATQSVDTETSILTDPHKLNALVDV